MLIRTAETSSGWMWRSRDVDAAFIGAAFRAVFKAYTNRFVRFQLSER